MHIGYETVAMGVIGLGAVMWAVRGAYRSIRKVGGCSSCASSDECPLVNTDEKVCPEQAPMCKDFLKLGDDQDRN